MKSTIGFALIALFAWVPASWSQDQIRASGGFPGMGQPAGLFEPKTVIVPGPTQDNYAYFVVIRDQVPYSCRYQLSAGGSNAAPGPVRCQPGDKLN